MTLLDYYWYSKAILGSTMFISALGIILRWKSEAKIRRPLAYMSIGLLVCCVVDLILSNNYEYHPLMLKSGCNFGSLFFALIVVVYSYIYTIMLFEPCKCKLISFVRYNIPIIFFVVGYALLWALGFENLPNYNFNELIGVLPSNPFASLWLMMMVTLIVGTIYVNVDSFRLMLIQVRKNKDNLECCERYNYCLPSVTYTLFTIAIPIAFIAFFVKLDILTELYFVCGIAMIMILLYCFTYFQKEIYPSSQLMPAEEDDCCEENVEKSRAMRESDLMLLRELEQLMVEGKLYRSTELTTELLARQLKVSRKKLYLFLRSQYGMSFLDYVNGYRLGHALDLMRSKDSLDLSIEQIAESSGFSSIKTFNNSFRNKYSITPNRFRNNMSLYDKRFNKKRVHKS